MEMTTDLSKETSLHTVFISNRWFFICDFFVFFCVWPSLRSAMQRKSGKMASDQMLAGPFLQQKKWIWKRPQPFIWKLGYKKVKWVLADKTHTHCLFPCFGGVVGGDWRPATAYSGRSGFWKRPPTARREESDCVLRKAEIRVVLRATARREEADGRRVGE
nr:hypothetical protein Iba_chr11dCG12850 [Ipomoea batatas]